MSERLLQQGNLFKKIVGRFSDHPKRLTDFRILFGEVFPYVFESIQLPCPVAELGGYNDGLINSLVTPQLCTELTNLTTSWKIGEKRGTVDIVGSVMTGSSHPHLYEVAKTETGTRLLLVDPENTVGYRNIFKPEIVVLLAAHIDTYTHAVEIAYIRHRSKGFNPHDLKLSPQYIVAESLFQNQGVPNGVLSKDITFRLIIDQSHSLIQSPLGTKKQLDKFLKTQSGHLPVEQRVRAIRDNLHLFPRLVEQENRGSLIYRNILKQVTRLKLG